MPHLGPSRSRVCDPIWPLSLCARARAMKPSPFLMGVVLGSNGVANSATTAKWEGDMGVTLCHRKWLCFSLQMSSNIGRTKARCGLVRPHVALDLLRGLSFGPLPTHWPMRATFGQYCPFWQTRGPTLMSFVRHKPLTLGQFSREAQSNLASIWPTLTNLAGTLSTCGQQVDQLDQNLRADWASVGRWACRWPISAEIRRARGELCPNLVSSGRRLGQSLELRPDLGARSKPWACARLLWGKLWNSPGSLGVASRMCGGKRLSSNCVATSCHARPL